MNIWERKHQPKELKDLAIHPTVTQLLFSVAKSFSFPHLLFCGPPGSGKKTRIYAFLRELFHRDVGTIHVNHRVIELPNKKIEIQVKSSDLHIEVTPSDAKMNDRFVISNLIKEIAQSKRVDDLPVKIIVINDAHLLSKLAQQALRRTMERYAESCRLILVSTSMSKLIEPIRSRCLVVRVPIVPDDAVENVVRDTFTKENVTIEEMQIANIVNRSQGNLSRAFYFCEMLSLHGTGTDIKNVVPDWEKYLDELCSLLRDQEPSIEIMKNVRTHLYELLVHNIAPTDIFRSLLLGILANVDKELAPAICDQAGIYELRSLQGTKPIMHLEAFVARFLAIYNEYLSRLNSDS